jgi:hypothetical protein
LILVAALAGLLGHGPASSATAQSRDGSVLVDYHRFEHYQADTAMRIRLSGRLPPGAEWRLAISRSFLGQAEVTAISPEPLRMEAGAERTVLVFAPEAGNAGTAEVSINYELRKRVGLVDAVIGLDGAEPVTLWIFVYL